MICLSIYIYTFNRTWSMNSTCVLNYTIVAGRHVSLTSTCILVIANGGLHRCVCIYWSSIRPVKVNRILTQGNIWTLPGVQYRRVDGWGQQYHYQRHEYVWTARLTFNLCCVCTCMRYIRSVKVKWVLIQWKVLFVRVSNVYITDELMFGLTNTSLNVMNMAEQDY